jgi:hypothetical protein
MKSCSLPAATRDPLARWRLVRATQRNSCPHVHACLRNGRTATSAEGKLSKCAGGAFPRAVRVARAEAGNSAELDQLHESRESAQRISHSAARPVPRATGDSHVTWQDRGAEAPGHAGGRVSCYGELGSRDGWEPIHSWISWSCAWLRLELENLNDLEITRDDRPFDHKATNTHRNSFPMKFAEVFLHVEHLRGSFFEYLGHVRET